MKKINKNVNGITLVSLIITIIVMIILSSIAIYSGKEVINSSKFTKFTTELKIMQTQVNKLYENKSEDNEILNLGKELGEAQAQADVVFTINASGITDQTGYRYFDKTTIKNLNIEGIEGEFFINIEKRSVVSYKGFKYEGVTYYTLEQLPGGLYNVGYENKNTGEPTFEISGKKTGENKWKVNIENIKYDGYIDKWKVNYKLEGQSDWNISKDYSFTVKEKGKYIVQIVNGMVKSEEKHLIIGQAPILPAEYQQVEYIESTGTQYIDTGITPDINTGFYLDIKILDPIDTNGKRLFGTAYRNSGRWGGIFIATYSSTNGGQMHYIESGNLYNPCLEYNNRMQISLRNGQYTTSTGADIKFDTSTLNMNTPGPIYILNVNSDVPATTYSSACLYKAQIYDGDVLVRNFIPCYEKKTGKIGLYDTVDDKFYTNQGTDKFLKGNDVIKLPSEYQQVEYIGGTGEQYFLLDVVSTANFGFDIDMSVSTGTGANVFGGFSRGGQVYCYMGTRNNKITYFPSTNSFDFTLTDYNVRHSYKVINKGSNLSYYYYDNIECGTRSFVNNANCSIAVFSFVDNNGVVRTSKTETFSGRIYKFIIYDNETVICNLIPCYKKSNNQVGMYDIINNKFYTNQGTGTFEKGADVN